MYIWYNAFSRLVIKQRNTSHESFWPYFDYIIRNVYHCCYLYYRVTDNRCDNQTRLDGQRNRRQGNLREQNSTIEERYHLSIDAIIDVCLCFCFLHTLKSVWKNYESVQKKLIKNTFLFIIWIADVLIKADIKYLDFKSISRKGL